VSKKPKPIEKDVVRKGPVEVGIIRKVVRKKQEIKKAIRDQVRQG